MSCAVSDDVSLPRFHRDEAVGRNSPVSECGFQRLHRRESRLIGELKTSPMHGQTQTRAQVEMDLNRVRGITVLGSHEPTWFIGADRDHRDVGRAKAIGNGFKNRRVVTRISGEVNPPLREPEKKATPEARASPAAEAVAPMLRRGERNLELLRKRVVFPPIQFDNLFETRATKKTAIFQGGDRDRSPAGCDFPERRQVTMIIVIVADQNQVDARDRLRIEPGPVHASRSEEAERSDHFTQNWIN